MAAARAVCRGCGRRIAVTATGRVWAHGRPRCDGSGRSPRVWWSRQRIWPTRLYGRRVVTLPDIAAWEPSRAA